MAKKAYKMTDLPTACRFAVLEVSDEEEEDDSNTVTKTATTDSATTNAKKKRNRRKKHRGRGGQQGEGSAADGNPGNTATYDNPGYTATYNNHGNTATDNNHGSTTVAEQLPGEEQEWQTWQNKDEKIILEQFQKDLQAALQASKVENLNRNLSSESSKPKKKEKPVAMSLEEFVTLPAENCIHPQINGTTANAMSSLDNFLDLPEQVEEKPQKTKSKKKAKTKTDVETKNKESQPETKKIVTATAEDFIKAEMVTIQERLEQKDEAVTDLHRTVDQQALLIGDLQKELAQVKKRNKQLCYMLAQGEMKEKSELLMQIEELNEVREQVVELHGELEQERSRSSALKQELAKSQNSSSRARHGSTS